MPRKKNLQFVWPKDGDKGQGHRGFFGRLNNIATGKGPDIFLQSKGSRKNIPIDRWSNWDSYHLPQALNDELRDCTGGLLGGKVRGGKRYDPYTRTYKEWVPPSDWNCNGIDWTIDPVTGQYRHGEYSRFTLDEYGKAARMFKKNGYLDESKMGREWTPTGPKRFRFPYDGYWRNAHRIGENVRQGLPPMDPPNPFFSFAQTPLDNPRRWAFQNNLPQHNHRLRNWMPFSNWP